MFILCVWSIVRQRLTAVLLDHMHYCAYFIFIQIIAAYVFITRETGCSILSTSSRFPIVNPVNLKIQHFFVDKNKVDISFWSSQQRFLEQAFNIVRLSQTSVCHIIWYSYFFLSRIRLLSVFICWLPIPSTMIVSHIVTKRYYKITRIHVIVTRFFSRTPDHFST